MDEQERKNLERISHKVAEVTIDVQRLRRQLEELEEWNEDLEDWVAEGVRFDMVTKYLEVDCFLCEKPRLDKSDDGWLEVGTMGPQRRAHSSCFHKVMFDIREINSGDDPLAFLAMVEARERERGIEPPPRDPGTVQWAERKQAERKGAA